MREFLLFPGCDTRTDTSSCCDLSISTPHLSGVETIFTDGCRWERWGPLAGPQHPRWNNNHCLVLQLQSAKPPVNFSSCHPPNHSVN